MRAIIRTHTSSSSLMLASSRCLLLESTIQKTSKNRNVMRMHYTNSDPLKQKTCNSNQMMINYDMMMRREFSNMMIGAKTLASSGWDWKKRAAIQRMADHKKEEMDKTRRIQFEVDTFRNKKHLEIHSITDKLSIKLIFPSMHVYDRVKDALTSTFHVEKMYQPHHHHQNESEEQILSMTRSNDEILIDSEEQVIEAIQDRPKPNTLSQIPPVLYFSYFDYDEILKFFTENFDDIPLEPIPNFVFEVLDHYDMMVKAFKARQKRNKSEYDLSLKLPTKMYSSILPFQKEGIEFGISRDGRVLLW